MAAVMTDAAREARRKYQREWNRKNADKRRQYMFRYWARKAQEAEKQRNETENSGKRGT